MLTLSKRVFLQMFNMNNDITGSGTERVIDLIFYSNEIKPSEPLGYVLFIH